VSVASPILWLLAESVASLQHPVMEARIGRETFDLLPTNAASDGIFRVLQYLTEDDFFEDTNQT
jgi:hypothetical protein